MDFNQLFCACGSKDFYLKQKGPNVGAYCSKCQKWLKWIGKKDLEVLKRRGMRVFPENYLVPSTAVPEPDFGDVPFDVNIGAAPTNRGYVNVAPPSFEEPIMDDPYYDSYGNTEMPEKKVENSIYHRTIPENDTCPLCSYGQLEPFGGDSYVRIVMFENIMTIKDLNGDVLGRYKLNACPICAKPLKN